MRPKANRGEAVAEGAGVEVSSNDSDDSGEFGGFICRPYFGGSVEVILFLGSWKLFLRGFGGRKESVKRYDDSTSSEDGHSEYESEGRNSDTDPDIDRVMDVGEPEVGLEIIGKSPP